MIVTYNSAEAVAAALPELVRGAGRRGRARRRRQRLERRHARAGRASSPRRRRCSATARNAGFAAAANRARPRRAATAASSSIPTPPRARLRRGDRAAAGRRTRLGGWMGLVTTDGGRVVNTSGGVVHFTGIAWAGEAGSRRPATLIAPREVGFLRARAWPCRARLAALRRLRRAFFMYHEDVDLSLRLRLARGPARRRAGRGVEHDYEFAKGPAKWRLLERNRWATIVRPTRRRCWRCWRRRWWPSSWRGRRRPRPAGGRRRSSRAARRRCARCRACCASAVRSRPRGGLRRRVRRWLTADLDSPYLGRIAASRGLNLVLRAYWRGRARPTRRRAQQLPLTARARRPARQRAAPRRAGRERRAGRAA